MVTNVSLSQWQTAQEREQDFWESYADTFERYHLAKLRDAGEYVRDEVHGPQIKETLEVGVGPLGVGVLGMQESDLRVTAIDPLPHIKLKIADTALDTYIRTLRERVAYRCSLGENLPFDDNCYDFVCCHNVIDHTQKPLAILEEIFRVLRSHCCLVLTRKAFSKLGRLKFESLRKLQPEKMIFTCHPHSFLHVHVLRALSDIGYEIVRHEGGHHATAGRSRLSRFLCRKPL